MYNRVVQWATRSRAVNAGGAMDATPNNGSGNMGAGALPIGNIAVYPDPKTQSYVKEGYSGNLSAYTVISFISRKFANMPYYLFQVKDEFAAKQYKAYIKRIDSVFKGHDKAVKALFRKAYSTNIKTKSYQENQINNAFTQLMNRPNPYMGADFFNQLCGIFYGSTGECIIWLNRGADADGVPLLEGEVLEMYPLPPGMMEIIPDPYNVWGSLGWIFNVAGKRIPIDNENIIHIRLPNPNFDPVTREHMRGLSPMRPARKKLTEDEAASDASVAMHQNNGARAVIFDKNLNGPGAKMSPTKETEIRRVIDRKVNYNDMKGAVAYIQGDLGVIDLAMSSVDQELEESKEKIFARICNAWGIAPDIFMQGTTFQNMIQARKDAVSSVILPMCCVFRDEYIRVLFPAFGLSQDRFSYDVDATQIQELQDDLKDKATALSMMSWLTPNEKRAETNYEPSDEEGADRLWVQTGSVLMEDQVMSGQEPVGYDPNAPADPVDDVNKILQSANSGQDKPKGSSEVGDQ